MADIVSFIADIVSSMADSVSLALRFQPHTLRGKEIWKLLLNQAWDVPHVEDHHAIAGNGGVRPYPPPVVQRMLAEPALTVLHTPYPLRPLQDDRARHVGAPLDIAGHRRLRVTWTPIHALTMPLAGIVVRQPASPILTPIFVSRHRCQTRPIMYKETWRANEWKAGHRN